MRAVFIYSLLLFFLLPGAGMAEPTPGPDANTPGDLKLVIVASESPDYINEWLTTPSNHPVTIKRLKIAKPNQLIVTAFLVTGMSGNKHGHYEFSVSFYVLDPDQKPIFGQRNYAHSKGELPTKPTFIMGDPALDIVLEESDPEGIYTIVGQVHDLVAGSKADNAYKINYIKSEL
jgi:hypothetical protein